ncbi:hypothetical protein A2335_03700 [Candidatus Peregrinibacteria bacterium RIFOXYB2_FULL_32_7]|nr:MAG: hypothetical protein A2335_03700 [Candidatus Peregrinibacteria bacterium RIFOXYB2_FULL_32_7]
MKKETEFNKKPHSWKLKSILFLLIIALGGAIYFYFWLSHANELRQNAQIVIDKVERYEILIQELKNENDRCQDFITQRQGDFGDFEYCKGYVNWYENNVK